MVDTYLHHGGIVSKSKTPAVAAILLAAGKSERMGENKLLLPFGKRLIIQRTLDNLIASRAQTVIVVLGSRAAEINEVIGQRNVTTVFNPNYAYGMNTSLAAGIKTVENHVKFILVALGDQPLVTTQTYDTLIATAMCTDKGILVPTYAGKRGNPIVLSIGYRTALLGLSGDIGGRELLRAYSGDVLEVPVEDKGIIININTYVEYEKQLKNSSEEAGGDG